MGGRVRDKQIERLIQLLDNNGLHEYVKLAGRPGKLLFMNFISGVARGLGFTVGTAIVVAILFKGVSHVISMNIPYLTDLLVDFVQMVKGIN